MLVYGNGPDMVVVYDVLLCIINRALNPFHITHAHIIIAMLSKLIQNLTSCTITIINCPRPLNKKLILTPCTRQKHAQVCTDIHLVIICNDVFLLVFACWNGALQECIKLLFVH